MEPKTFKMISSISKERPIFNWIISTLELTINDNKVTGRMFLGLT